MAVIFVAVAFWVHAGYHVPACTTIKVETMNSYINGFTDRATCTIHINSLLATAFRRGTINKLCTTVTHEMGHMLGKGHTKRGIMAARYGQAYIPRGCRRLRAPQRVRTGQSVGDLNAGPRGHQASPRSYHTRRRGSR